MPPTGGSSALLLSCWRPPPDRSFPSRRSLPSRRSFPSRRSLPSRRGGLRRGGGLRRRPCGGLRRPRSGCGLRLRLRRGLRRGLRLRLRAGLRLPLRAGLRLPLRTGLRLRLRLRLPLLPDELPEEELPDADAAIDRKNVEGEGTSGRIPVQDPLRQTSKSTRLGSPKTRFGWTSSRSAARRCSPGTASA